MKRFLAIAGVILACATGWAQEFTFTDLPLLGQGKIAGTGGGLDQDTNIIYAIHDLAWWWVASDVPTNHAISNQWADRIQGRLLAQGDPAKQPTNSTQGVYFDGAGNTYLTNVAVHCFTPGGQNVTVLWVWQVDTTSAYQYVWASTGAAPVYAFQINSDNSWSYAAGALGDKRSAGPLPDNQLMDFLARETRFYTNGVLNTNRADAMGGSDWGYMGGQGGNGPYPFKGYIRELIVWTNTGQQPVDATTLSNLHYYATNRYKFTP